MEARVRHYLPGHFLDHRCCRVYGPLGSSGVIIFRRLLLWTALLFVPVCGVMLIATIPPTDVLIGFTIYFVALWTFSEDVPYSTRIRGAFTIAAVFLDNLHVL